MGVISFYDVAKAVVDGAGLREPHAQGLHPRLAGRRGRRPSDEPAPSAPALPESTRPRTALGPCLRCIAPMSGSTFGELFRVTNFGESHGPAIGCVIDGCPPGHGAERGRHPARARPPPPRHQPPRDAAQRARRGGDPVRRLRGPDHRHADLPADPQHRPAQQGLRQPARHLPPRPRRLHLLAQVRPARPARRRPRVGAPDRADGRRRRGGAQVAARAARHRRSRLDERSWARSRSRSRAGSTSPHNPFFAANAEHRAAARGAHGRAAQGRRLGAARASTSRAHGVPVGLGEPLFDKLDADIAYAMMGINAVKGVEIGAGFGVRRPARQRARRRADARRASPATTPAACSAASAPGRT